MDFVGFNEAEISHFLAKRFGFETFLHQNLIFRKFWKMFRKALLFKKAINVDFLVY